MEEVLKISLKINQRELTKIILEEIVDELQDILSSSFNGIVQRTRKLVEEAIKTSPEYISAQSGELRPNLGMVDSTLFFDNVIKQYVEGIIVKPNRLKVSSGKIRGGFQLVISTITWDKLINNPYASYISQNRDGQLSDVDWLEWMLLSGRKPMVYKHTMETKRFNRARSRTKQAIMRPHEHKFWRLPAKYSGTKNNNFITRSIIPLQEEIEIIVGSELSKVFR